MADSYIDYTDKGPGDTLGTPPFLLKAHIQVKVGEVVYPATTPFFSWTGAQEITLGASFPSSSDVRIIRVTPRDEGDLVDMSPTGTFDYRGADTNWLRQQYILQEVADAVDFGVPPGAADTIAYAVSPETITLLDSVAVKTVEVGSDGSTWDWRDGTAVAFNAKDPTEAIHKKDPDRPLTAGAWYRRLRERPSIVDFRGRGDDSTANDTAFYDLIMMMEYYPTRTRLGYIPPGIFRVNEPIEVPSEVTHMGVKLLGDGKWDSNIRMMDKEAVTLFNILGQEFKVENIGFLNNTGDSGGSNSPWWTAGAIALNADKGIGKTADVDLTVTNCRFQGFRSAIKIKGRGLAADGNHFSVCRYGVELDSYDAADYIGDETVDPDEFAFTDTASRRGYFIANGRAHSMDYSIVANIGANAHLMVGIQLANYLQDIGRRNFYGHLGRESSIIGCKSVNSRTACLELWGGENFTIADCTFAGGSVAVPESTSANLVQFSNKPGNVGTDYGYYKGGAFRDIILAKCEQHAVYDDSLGIDGTVFDGIQARDVSVASAGTYSVITFTSAAGNAVVRNVTYTGTANIHSIIRSNTDDKGLILSELEAPDLPAVPHYHGSTAAKVLMRTDEMMDYAPTMVTAGGANVDASVAVNLKYKWLDYKTIQINGRITIDATAAGDTLTTVRLPLPVPSNFTSAEDAGGQLTCTSAGNIRSGQVLADTTNDNLILSYLSGSTSNLSFNVNATYIVK